MSLAPMPSLTLELPEPPSANRWWRHVVIKGQVRVLLSEEARTYKQTVGNRLLVSRVRPIRAPQAVSVHVTWYRGRKAGDLDKRLGVLLDALQGSLYENDSQVTLITARREDDPRNARVVVTVSPDTVP